MADDLEDEWWLPDKLPADNPVNLVDEDISKPKKVKDVIKPKTTQNGIKSKKQKKKQDDVKQETVKIEDKALTENSSKKTKLKRKAGVADSKEKQDEAESENQPVKKKKKTRNRKKISEELQVNKSVPGKPEDFINTMKKSYEGKLSQIEWDELELEGDNFFECSESTEASALLYFKKILPAWQKLVKSIDIVPGSPLLLVITNSGARAVELNREIMEFKGKNCRCAKLFAKHFKIEDQQKFLKNKICHVGIGTPQRIHKLIKLGHLKVSSLTAIVIDWNWRDIKFKRIMDIPEIKKDILDLFKDSLIAHVQYSSCKIGLL